MQHVDKPLTLSGRLSRIRDTHARVHRRLSQIRDIQLLHPLINYIVTRSRSIAASTIELFKQSVFMAKTSFGYPFGHTQTGKHGPGYWRSTTPWYIHLTISDFYAYPLAFLLKSKLTRLVGDRVDCSFLRLGSKLTVFRHRAATIYWLVKTTPSTIEKSLQSGIDDAFRLEQHWRRHGKRLLPSVRASGLGSYFVLAPPKFYWTLRLHAKYSINLASAKR